MRREMNLEEISDGKLYSVHDMVKADCQDCQGCSACCQGMGASIVLDPLDVWQLKVNLKMTFQELMENYIELNVVDHIILPNLKMSKKPLSTTNPSSVLVQNHSEELIESCNFLDENGRCSIHAFRPGICRIFPLGRVYDHGSFQYFLQIKECEKKNRTKVKVSKWIDCQQVKANQKFIAQWHFLLKDIEKMIIESQEAEALKDVSMYLLHQFYNQEIPEEEAFYGIMERKIKHVREGLGLYESEDR